MRKVRSETGLTAKAVRYYERQGLLGEVERSPAGWRLYGRRQVAQLLEIQRFRADGFTIRQIESLLDPDTSPEELDRWASTLDEEARSAFEHAQLFRQAAQERRRIAS